LPVPPVRAVLTDDYRFKPALTCFLPVRVAGSHDGRCLATPVVTNTSSDFAALSGTAGYLELALAQQEFASGSAWPLHRWASLD
jgi:molybdopterin molybdotransferase